MKSKKTLCVVAGIVSIAVLFIASFYNWDKTPKTNTTNIDLTCAKLCEAIYSQKTGTELESELLELGFDQVNCFEKDNHRVAVCSNDEHVVLVFRGTDNAGNWITNANITHHEVLDGTVHKGFYDANQLFHKSLVDQIAEHGGKTKPVYVTGHSLGGAMATIFSYLTSVQGEVEVQSLVTFGQPLALNKDVAKKLNKLLNDRYRRFVNETDIVTRLIPTFSHAGQRIHLTEEQASLSEVGIGTKSIAPLVSLTESEFVQLKKDLAADQAGSNSGVMAKSSAKLLSNHSMTGYISKVKKYLEQESSSTNGKAFVGQPVSPSQDEAVASFAIQQQPTNLEPGLRSGKLAVLVGINDYQSTDVSDLKGCVSDVVKMKELLLTKFGFEEEDILTLTNEQATKSSIVEAFENHLIGRAKDDKVAMFYFSGHGSQMTDGPDNDELDELDETIVPVDSRMPGKFDISDDQLNGLVNRLTEVTKFATVMLDCCHSGSGTKSGYTARRTTPDTRIPPAEPPYSLVEPKNATTQGLMQVQQCALVFGCRDDELSYEMNLGENGVRSGLLTHYFVDACRRIDGVLTYQVVMDYVTGSVEQKIKFQHPQLEGTNANTEVFGVKDQKRIKYTKVKAVSGDLITLSAGTIHGVTEGSIYAVFPANTEADDVDKAAGVRFEITDVDGSESKAKFVDTGKKKVEIGSKAIELSHSFNDPKIAVFIGNPLQPNPSLTPVEQRVLGEVRRKLADRNEVYKGTDGDELPGLKYVDRFKIVGDPADARLFVVATEGVVGVFGGDVEVKSEAANGLSKWSDTISLEDGNADSKLLDQLFRWSQWFERLDLDNLSQGPTIEYAIVAKEPLNGEPSEVLAGSDVEVHFKNNHSKKLYFSILDFSTDGQIGMIFPPIGAPDQAVEAGKRWLLPSGKVPSTKLSILGDREEVIDHFKIVVSEVPIRLDALAMPPIGEKKTLVGRRGIAERLEKLVDRLGGVRTKNGATIGVVDTDSWATQTCTVRVKAK